MLSIHEGVSIFDTDANVLVNPVNCVGAMGKGLALEFKSRYPANFNTYYHLCHQAKMLLGKVLVTYGNDPDGKIIINFPTKGHWRYHSKLEWIESGLQDMVQYLNPGDTVAIPLLGCGEGHLNSGDVVPLIRYYLGNIPDVEVYLCCFYYNEFAELI